jgi:diguanylate cyclase (GGDEF)-like protein/PAS domain S-box-containing protein
MLAYLAGGILSASAPAWAEAASDAGPITIRLGTYISAPVVIADPEAGLGGYLGDYIRALQAPGLIRFDIVYFADPPALADALRAGRIDAAAPLFKREGREAFADFTRPVEAFSVAIFGSTSRSSDNIAYWDLADKRIAVVGGSYTAETMAGDLPQAHLLLVDSEVAAFTALAADQVDYVVAGLARALHAIDQHSLKHILLTGYAPFARQLAFAVSKDRPDFLDAIEAAMLQVPPGQVKAIRNKWLTQLERPWYQRPAVIPALILVNFLVAGALLALWLMRRTLSRRSTRLHQTQRLLDRTSRSALVGGWEYDVAKDEITLTEHAHLINGTTPGTFVPSVERALSLCDEASVPLLRAAFWRCCQDGTPFEMEFKLRTLSGTQIWASVSGEAEYRNHVVTRVFGSLRNIDELKRQQLELERSERLYRALANATSDIVSVHDRNGVCLYASPSLLTLTGFAPDRLIGRHPRDLGLLEDHAAFDLLLAATREHGGVREATYRFRDPGGGLRWFEHRANLMAAEDLDGDILIVSRDITERVASQEYFEFLALHDSLTGLQNRLALSRHLAEAVATASRDSTGIAVCFIDTDNFKAINDSFGHTVGDKVVKEFAHRAREAAGGHMVSRIGGDEFVVLIASPDAAAAARDIAAALMQAFAVPIDLPEASVTLTASVGIAHYPADAASAEELLSAASTAMYAAKADGKNTCRSYTRELGRASVAKARALQDVRGAYERRELELFYQPKIRLDDGTVSGAEALLRWRTRNGDLRGPAELIAAAEDSGFIKTLGRWVLETAALQALAWADEGLDCPIAVNVSVKQLHDGEFLCHLASLVARDRRLAGRLELEITETAIATDADSVLQLLTEIRKLGVRVHIDDFGTGYSSLSYLGRLPVDTLKIDMSLVKAATTARDAREIVRAIIALAGSLALETIAEGVETAAQADLLRELGCTQAQGYLYAKPTPAAETARFCRLRRQVPLESPA